MNSRNEHEQDERDNYPPRRKCVPPEGFPSDCCGDKSQRQTNIPETNMNLLVTSGTTFAIFETLPVFLDRQHSLRIHQVLRAWSSVWWHLLFGAANKLPVLRRDEFDHDYIDLLRWAGMRWVSSRSNRRAALRILSWAF